MEGKGSWGVRGRGEIGPLLVRLPTRVLAWANPNPNPNPNANPNPSPNPSPNQVLLPTRIIASGFGGAILQVRVGLGLG